MFFKSCLFITFLIAAAYCDDLEDLTDLVRSGFGFDALNAGQDKATEMIKQKCLENADEQAFLDLMDGHEEFTKCTGSLINVKKLMKDMESVKPPKQIQKVVRKLCKKVSQLKTCVDTYAHKLKRCMSRKERKLARVAFRVIHKMVEFVCSKDGNMINNFIAKGGPQCLKANARNVLRCAKSTFSMGAYDSTFDFKKNCNKIPVFRQCAVTKLKTCPNLSAAKFFNDLVNNVLHVIPCKTSNAPNGRFL